MYSIVYGHKNNFLFGDIENNASMYIPVYVFWWKYIYFSGEYVLSIRMFGWYIWFWAK